jgi:hypothetical protein
MEDRFCPNCGTEVEADARFCPTCGTTLSAEAEGPDSSSDEPQLPPAPVWPPPESPPAPVNDQLRLSSEAVPEPVPEPEPQSEPEPEPTPQPQPKPTPSEPGPVEGQSVPAPEAVPPPPPKPTGATTGARPDLPITWPTMLSGWLIGGGSLLGALALIPRLGSVVSLLLFLALVGVAATVFLAERVPEAPRQRLAILVVTMIGLGVGLARAGFSVQGADTVLLVAMLAAAGGALLIELDRDQPMPPPERPG